MIATRQQWLAKFLELIDTKAPALRYRREMGIPFSALPAHVASIQSYRDELAALNTAAAPTTQLNKAKGKKSGEERN